MMCQLWQQRFWFCGSWIRMAARLMMGLMMWVTIGVTIGVTMNLAWSGTELVHAQQVEPLDAAQSKPATLMSQDKQENISVQPVKSRSLVIYTSRGEELIQPVIELFEAQSGVQVKFQTGSSGMFIEKMKAQHKNVEADIFMTVDAGNLWAAKEAGLLAQIPLSKLVDQEIPARYRDPDNQWLGVSLRVRTIMYNPRLVQPAELSSYADLAHSKWQGKLCLRTARKVYNQSLVAMLIHHHGLTKTTEIVEGWIKNLARPVFSNDTHLIKAIAAGGCLVGIANSYYLGRLQRVDPQIQAKIFWASDSTTGVHVNVSGIGVLKHTKRRQTAHEFVKFLFTPKAQQIFSQLNFEYPVLQQVSVDPLVAGWGTFRASKMPLSEVGRLQQAAIKLMDGAGYR